MNAAFKDENGNLAAPTTAQWRVYNPEAEEVVVDWQDLVPVAAQVSFVVPGIHHVIVDEHKVRERRSLQVRIDVGLAKIGRAHV